MLSKAEKKRLNDIESKIGVIDDVGVQFINKAINESLAKQRSEKDEEFAKIILKHALSLIETCPRAEQIIAANLDRILSKKEIATTQNHYGQYMTYTNPTIKDVLKF